MSDYKEYRPKARILARVVERTIKIPLQIVPGGNDPEFRTVNAGDYEVLAEDGTVSYQAKADFDAANEPVRRQHEPKAASKTGSGGKKRQAAASTSTAT